MTEPYGSGLFVFLIYYSLKRYFYLFAFWKKRRYVGHYVIDRIIGYGGMATVFLVHHMLNRKKIAAVKILKREFAARSASRFIELLVPIIDTSSR